MSITLRLMGHDDLASWIEASKAGLVAELVAAGRPAEKAAARVEAQYSEWFPNGAPDEGHRVYIVEQDGQKAGIVWLGPHPNRPSDLSAAWLYDIEIDEAFRGSGIGRAALSLAEEAAREAGTTTLELNVFGANSVARGLYRSAGYNEVAITLAKVLKGQN